jgi:hypothetical protein
VIDRSTSCTILSSFYLIRSKNALDVAYVTKLNATGNCSLDSMLSAALRALADIPFTLFFISVMKLSTMLSSAYSHSFPVISNLLSSPRILSSSGIV